MVGLTLAGEQTTLSAASLCRWVIKRETGGRQDSTKSIPVGVAEQHFVVYLWTLCQKVFRQFAVPMLGVNRSAPWARARRREKGAEGSRAGVNQFPSPRTESLGWNTSALIWIGEVHFGECLWLGVLQCMSSVFGTEKEIPRRDTLISSFSKRSWRRRMFPQYERDATVRAKSSTYDIIRPRRILKCRGAT